MDRYLQTTVFIIILTESLVIGQGWQVLMVHQALVTRPGYPALDVCQAKWLQGTGSPGLQIRVTLWPHCPEIAGVRLEWD